MDEQRLFAGLRKQKKAVLFDLLEAAYERMSTSQRTEVFGKFAEEFLQSAKISGEGLLELIEEFQHESLNGFYYAPFRINSQNFSHIPEETEAWFDRLGDYLKESTKLTAQGDHFHASACFTSLYGLISAMERGEEIVFADECGSWMIPGDEKTFVQAYMTSLAAVKTPEGFTAAVLPLIKRDSYHSFCTKAYESAVQAASKDQIAILKTELKNQKIRTSAR